MQEHSNNLGFDKEYGMGKSDTQEKVDADLRTIYNKMAYDCIYDAYQYYWGDGSDTSDSLWDSRMKELATTGYPYLEQKFKDVITKVSPDHVSLFFLKTEDYEKVLDYEKE